MMDDLSRKRLEHRLQERLSPERVSKNLLDAALYLVAYELLEAEIVDKTRGFFSSGFKDGKAIPSPEYKTHVKHLHRDLYRASCLWLASNGAISDSDVAVAEAIQKHRREVAHELPRFLVDPDANIDAALFSEAYRLLIALGRFWGGIAADTNPDFDGEEVNYAGIKSGAVLLMEYILTMISKHDT